jgi:hypothetical protein
MLNLEAETLKPGTRVEKRKVQGARATFSSQCERLVAPA